MSKTDQSHRLSFIPVTISLYGALSYFTYTVLPIGRVLQLPITKDTLD